jgi:lipopolysaccharide export system protein LptA
MMKFSNRLRRGTFFSRHWKTAWVFMLLCVAAVAQEAGMEISGFRVPEYDEQGQMTSQLFGDHAELGKDGVVKIEGVRVELYRNGEVFITVISPGCFYNQKSREVRSDEVVSAESDGIRVTGSGYLLDVEKRTVQVLDNSRVVFSDGLQQSVIDSAAQTTETNDTVITSKQLFLDYNARKTRFTDSVHIQNQEASLNCGLLDVFFNENNQIEQAVATSDVTIFNQETTLACEKLNVFFTNDSQIERALAESGVVLTNAEWRVSGERGTLMYLERRAFIEGDVQVESKEMKMSCATLNLSFNESNEINWIEATDEVRITNEGRKAYAGRAAYDVKTDEFLLENNPKLVDGKNMLMGDRIRFWRSTGRMVCEPARAVIFPDEKFKTELFEK